MSIAEILRNASARINPVDARVLLGHVMDRDSAYLIAHRDDPLNDTEARAFEALVERRAAGEPVAYITGQREFYGRPFSVTPAVLIPRPETEVLVDSALERIPGTGRIRVLDVGTGSGCVAIAIATERPQCRLLAVDRSLEALAIARRNAVALRVGNVAFLKSDWFEALGTERFDMIVSNPPYIALGDPHLTQGDLRFEPQEALCGGADGLDAVRTLVLGGIRHLTSAGWLVLEHGYDQGPAVRALFADNGYVDVVSATDISGIERVTAGRLTFTLRTL